jgi:hypothetical protein
MQGKLVQSMWAILQHKQQMSQSLSWVRVTYLNTLITHTLSTHSILLRALTL